MPQPRQAGLTARQEGGRTATPKHGGVFASAQHGWLLMFLGRAVRGAARLAGSFFRSVNPHGLAHPRLTAGGRGSKPQEGATIMVHVTSTGAMVRTNYPTDAASASKSTSTDASASNSTTADASASASPPHYVHVDDAFLLIESAAKMLTWLEHLFWEIQKLTDAELNRDALSEVFCLGTIRSFAGMGHHMAQTTGQYLRDEVDDMKETLKGETS
jgi:hypothetical protein